MMKGETVLSGGQHPGTPLRVLQSPNGWYLGFLDKDGLPYSRESIYYQSSDVALYVLNQLRSS